MYSYFFKEISFIGGRCYWLAFIKSKCTKRTANNYLFKVNDKSTGTRCELYSKLKTQTSGRSRCSCSVIFIFNLEHVSCLVLVSIVDFKKHFKDFWDKKLELSLLTSLDKLNKFSIILYIKDQKIHKI